MGSSCLSPRSIKPTSASLALTDFSQVDILAPRYKSVNFEAENRPGEANWCAQVDCGNSWGQTWRVKTIGSSCLSPRSMSFTNITPLATCRERERECVRENEGESERGGGGGVRERESVCEIERARV